MKDQDVRPRLAFAAAIGGVGLWMSLFAFTPQALAMGGARSAVATYSDSRAFTFRGQTAAPMDFQSMDLHLVFDSAELVTIGRATIDFTATADGYPYFFLDGYVQQAQLDGSQVGIARDQPWSSTSTFSIPTRSLKAGTAHRLVVQYVMPKYNVTMSPGRVRFLTAMGDLKVGRFFEQYGPSSFENDPHRIRIEIEITGATYAHRIFANGQISPIGAKNHWSIDFPEFFNSNMLYLHVTDASLAVVEGTYRGLEREIPFTAYAKSAKDAQEAARQLPGLFAELESDYGPYLHRSFIAYISGKGGMEHGGAAVTSIGAMDHELLHQWFGRGVLPSDGRSGWIDEGVAAWRDDGYARASWPPNRKATNLADFVAYERFTPKNCYDDGSQLMSELDAYLAPRGGLKPVLKELFAEWKTHNLTTPLFQTFLEIHTGLDLRSVFRRYVFGDSSVPAAAAPSSQLVRIKPRPAPLTRQEILELR
jgi:hypothetical protein